MGVVGCPSCWTRWLAWISTLGGADSDNCAICDKFEERVCSIWSWHDFKQSCKIKKRKISQAFLFSRKGFSLLLSVLSTSWRQQETGKTLHFSQYKQGRESGKRFTRSCVIPTLYQHCPARSFLQLNKFIVTPAFPSFRTLSNCH